MSSDQDSLYYKLYNRIEQLINKDKEQEIDWTEIIDVDSDIEMED